MRNVVGFRDDLCDLPAGHAHVDAEVRAREPCDDAVVVERLNECVERVARRHVREVRPASGGEAQLEGIRDDLRRLAARPAGATA